MAIQRYLIYNPDTATTEVTEYLDGIEVESVTNKTLYGYLSDDGREILPQPKPAMYITEYDPESGITTYIDIHTYIDFNDECTQQWMEDYGIILSEEEAATAYTCSYSGIDYYVIWSYDDGGTWKVCYGPGIEADVYAANPEDALYVGTFNLVNGTSVVIVDVWNGYLIDENDEYHRFSRDMKFSYFNVPETPTLYLFKTKRYGSTDYDYHPIDYCPLCTKLGNGKYHRDGMTVDFESTSGSYVNIKYRNLNDDTQFSEDFILESVTYGSVTIPVTDSAGTQTEATVQRLFTYFDTQGNKVYGGESGNTSSGKGVLYTGSTMSNLTWYGGDDYVNTEYYDYQIVTEAGLPGCVAFSDPVPGVAYTPVDGSVFYNKTSIPVYSIRHECFVYSFGKTATFNLNRCLYYQRLCDIKCGSFESLSPSVVEKFLFDGVDKTNDFKTGIIEEISPYQLCYRDNNWNWVHGDELEITFTDEFVRNGVLKIYFENCGH